MARRSSADFYVGLFMILGVIAFFILAIKVSGLSNLGQKHGYAITADFDNIGALKVRAPVTIAGVRIGEVDAVNLDPITFKARVIIHVDDKDRKIPEDSSVKILTQGLLGANYIALTPGYEEQAIKPGGAIQETHPALILENLIGQFLFNINNKKKD